MKKIIPGFAFLIASAFLVTTAQAQDVAGGGFLNQKSTKWMDPETGRSHAVIGINEVNVAAARDFMRKYANATDAKWVKGKNGTSVYFTYDGFKMRSTYDSKGKREYTLKYYDEFDMPAALRHQVKSNYYDYRIDNVTEVERNGSLYHIVKMQNGEEYLTISVHDGELSVMEKVQKLD